MNRRSSTVALVILLSALIAASACKSDKTSDEKTEKTTESSKEETMAEPLEGWERVHPRDLPQSKKRKLARAEQAKREFGQALIETLTDAIGQGDYANAIKVCNTEAPAITKKVAKSQDVQIGRTSFKLRNPENTPPDWAQAYIDRRVDETMIVNGPGESVGYLSPIKTGELCTKCHGPADQLPDQVTAALEKQYPNDQATGFEEGDLRGWFWVRID